MTQNILPDPTLLAFQTAVAGLYSIDRELGRGGMGIVYLAHELHLDRLVAIKVLPPERATEPALRDRFLREARLAAKLSHPNIIPIHSVAESGDFVYFVMTFVDGVTLSDRVRSRGPLSVADGVRVLREVTWALAHAHSLGLEHRDVKPDNILMETNSGRALVADFGIAAVVADTDLHGAAGTPEFMSPEQAAGGALDARSDIYSLGATAFFAFSGRVPFEGRSATEILAKHATQAPPTLASSGITVPRRVAALIDRCLAKEPAGRPASAEVVSEQLGLALDQRRDLPVALRAFVKRNSRLDGGGTLIATTALAGSAVGIANLYGGEAGWLTLAVGAAAGPLAFMVNAARGLIRQGFAYADIAPAYQREQEQVSEELSVDRQPRMAFLERVLRPVGITGVTVFGVSVASLLGIGLLNLPMFNPAGRSITNALLYGVMFGGMFGLPASLGYLALLQRRTDVDTGFWAKVWKGPIGRLAFSIARRSGGLKPAAAAMTHRATELSLGLAAEQLYESLPKATQQAISEVPAVLKRLQDDAQSLRKRLDQLQGALNESQAVNDSPEYADLQSMRDDAQARLGESVGTLETLRLGLLRLHAGSATVEGFTTHLHLAADVSDQVSRLVSAREDVDNVLRFPSPPVITPA
jgi:serine/threonine-protein kinase